MRTRRRARVAAGRAGRVGLIAGRRGRIATALVVAGALGVLTACIEFLAPQPGPPGLRVTLILEEAADGPRVSLSAFFSPGPDADGAPRPVARDTLWIWDDHPFTPRHTTYDGDLAYQEVRELTDELARRSVNLEGPRLRQAAAPPPFWLPVIIRDGPDSVSVNAEGDLALPVRVPQMVAEVESVRWLLFIVNPASDASGPAGPRIRLEGEGPPPGSVEVSAEELAELGDGALEASFFVALNARREIPGDYPQWVSLQTRWFWHILRGEAEGP